MKIIGNRVVWIVLIIGVIGSLEAHNPSDIGYVVNERDRTVTVHTTQKALIDLLGELNPNLLGQKTFQLNNYERSYSLYFNRTIIACINDQEIFFSLNHSDFLGHDVVLTFDLVNVPIVWKKIELEVISFLDVYNRPKNTVKIVMPTETKIYFLNKNERSCIFYRFRESFQ